MPKKKKLSPEQRFLRNMELFRESGIKKSFFRSISDFDIEYQNLNDRVTKIIALLETIQSKKLNGMLCFIMYDISDSKIRLHISKYLKRKGCLRVQRSVFIGNINAKVYRDMCDTLAEVNDLYENSDSIFILPVAEDNINSMKVIGENIDFTVVKEDPNTYFF